MAKLRSFALHKFASSKACLLHDFTHFTETTAGIRWSFQAVSWPPKPSGGICSIAQSLLTSLELYRTAPSASVFSVGSAFQPFHAHKESVIMKAERISPDSSSDRVERLSPSKSDCESISSSASFSPSQSSEDHPETSAIRRALDGNSSDEKKVDIFAAS
ncbi:unnamed protein product [Nippostrongylus brasiliensis]|uniref:Uncharacterized protein n=1 Tax=Nippostrongylus brasiliensis TaxID=27835 RepID=A0A0N4YJ85_NIPBR|nr:unnamed protein product [Nippostrongylus brasiliensis]